MKESQLGGLNKESLASIYVVKASIKAVRSWWLEIGIENEIVRASSNG